MVAAADATALILEAVYRATLDDQITGQSQAIIDALRAINDQMSTSDDKATSASKSWSAYAQKYDDVSRTAKQLGAALSDLAGATAQGQAKLDAGTISATQFAATIDPINAKIAALTDTLTTQSQQYLVAASNTQKLYSAMDALGAETQKVTAIQAQFNAVLGVTDANQTAYQKRAADIAAYGAALDAQRGSVDKVFASSKAYEAQLEAITTTAKTQGLSSQWVETQQDAATAAFARANQPLQKAKDGMDGLALGTAGAYREIIVLGHEIISGNFSRIPGSLMVLAERSGGLDTIVQSMWAAFTSPVGLVVAGFTAVVGAAAAVAAAVTHQQNAILSFQSAVRTTHSDYVQLADDAKAAADAISGVGTGISTDDALQALKILTAQANFTGTQTDMQALLVTTNNLAIALGVKLPQAAQTVASAMQDPGKIAEDLASRGMFDLNAKIVESIRNMQNAGNVFGAFGILMGQITTKIDGNADAVGGITKAYRAFINFMTSPNVAGALSVSGDAVPFTGTPQVGSTMLATGQSAQTASGQISQYNDQISKTAPISDDVTAAINRAKAAVQEHTNVMNNASAVVAEADSVYNKHIAHLDSFKAAYDALNPADKNFTEDQATLTRSIILEQDEIGKLQNSEYGVTKAKTEHAAASDKLLQKLNDENEGLQAQIDASGKSSEAETNAIALAKAKVAVISSGLIPGMKDYASTLANVYQEEQKHVALLADQSLQKQAQANSDQTAMYIAEAGALTMSTDARTLYLAHLQAELDLKRKFPTADQSWIDAELKSVDAMTQAKIALDNQKQGIQELQSLITSAFDSISNAITQSLLSGTGAAINWRNIMTSAAQQVLAAFLKLAVLNPILNSLGGNNSTLSTVISALGSLGSSTGSNVSSLGGSSAAATSAAAAVPGGVGGFGDVSALLSAGSAANTLSGGSLLESLGITGPNGLLSGLGGVTSGVQGFLSTPLYGAGSLFNPSTAAALASEQGTLGTSLAAGEGVASSATLGSFLGGAGLGFGAGTLLNSLVGGKQTGGTVGAGVGSIAGAAIGSIFGPAGSIIGGLLGGTAGGGLGGLFGPNKASAYSSVGLSTDASGQLQIGQVVSQIDDTTQLLSQTTQDVNTLNQYMQSVGVRINSIGDTTQIGQNTPGGFQDPSKAASIGDAFTGFQFAANDPQLNSALQIHGGFSDPGSLQTFVTGFQTFVQQTLPQLTAILTPATAATDAYTTQLQQLQVTYDAAISQAQVYGIATDQLTQAYQKQIDAVNAARQAQIDKADGEVASIVSPPDANTAALNAFDTSAAAVIAQITADYVAAGLTFDQAAQKVLAAQDVFAQQRYDLVQQQTEATQAAADTLSRTLGDINAGYATRLATATGSGGDAAALAAQASKATDEVAALVTQLEGLGVSSDQVATEVSALQAVQAAETAALVKQQAATLAQSKASATVTALTLLQLPQQAAELQAQAQAANDNNSLVSSGINSNYANALTAAQAAQSIFQEAQTEYLAAIDKQTTALQADITTTQSAIAAQQANTQALQTASTSLKSFRDGLSTGALSTLSPGDQLDTLRKQFGTAALQAADGTQSATDRATAAQTAQTLAQSYLTAAASYFGNSTPGYASAYNDTQNLLSYVQSSLDSDGATQQSQLDVLNAQLTAEQDQLTAMQAFSAQVTALGQAQTDSLDNLNNTMDQAFATLQTTLGALYSQFVNGDAEMASIIIADLSASTTGHAAGGWVRNGKWNKDSVYARMSAGGGVMLAGGEFVVNAPAAARHPNTLAEINAGTFTPGNNDNAASQRAILQELVNIKRTLADAGTQTVSELKKSNRMNAQSVIAVKIGQQRRLAS